VHDFLAISKALSDRNRVRALLALSERELCICQITALLDLAPSTVSKHMTILRQAGLVEVQKSGRWVNCRLAADDATSSVRHAIAWVRDSLAASPEIRADRKRLKDILKIDPEILCRRQGLR
jgi:ArsR family transcriptional regulator